VLIRDPHATFATQALLCTDLDATPAQILNWFVQRWQLEVTFQQARRHLGLETQRQWDSGGEPVTAAAAATERAARSGGLRHRRG